MAQTVVAVIDAGAVGINLEDNAHGGTTPLLAVEEQCARIAAARQAADRYGLPLVINARTDAFIVRRGADDADKTRSAALPSQRVASRDRPSVRSRFIEVSTLPQACR